MTFDEAISRRTGPAELVLRTRQADPEHPSFVELAVELNGVNAQSLWL